MSSDDYLWRPSAPPDPEVEALERALRPFRHQTATPRPAAVPRPRRAVWRVWMAAAALLISGLAWWLTWPAGGSIELVVEARQQRLFESQRFVASGDERLRLDEFGELTLFDGAELEVQRLAAAQTRLFLHRGRLDALVYLNAKPRFFQVGTPAARCIDLGCRYTLTVDDAGNAHVVVETGRVVFENDGREVYVPAHASCSASPTAGAATPRFADTPSPLEAAIEAYDVARRAGEDRAISVARLLAAAAASGPKHSLSVWHLLQDQDPAVAQAAEEYLIDRYGRPNMREGVERRETWLDVLSEDWPW